MNRWRDAPLGYRLTLLHVGLLAGLLLAFGGIVYIETRQFLATSTALRQQAQAKPVIERWLLPDAVPESPTGAPAPPWTQPTEATSATIAAPTIELERIAADLDRDLTSTDTAALVFDRSGAVLAGEWRLPEEPVSAPPEPARVAQALAGDEVTYRTSVAGQDVLVTLLPLRQAAGHSDVLGLVQLTTRLDLAEEVLWHQRIVLALGVLLALLLGTLGSLWVTRSAMAPLRHMIVTCQRIAAGHLGERVDLPQRRDEIGQLATAFDDMASRIEAAFAARRRFIADAAHELRTPLTALVGSLEVLLRGAQDDPATARGLIHGMYHEATRLNRLAERLLDLSRLDAQAGVVRQLVAMPTFLEQFLPRAGVLAPDRVLRIEPGPPVAITADADRLQQVLFHLVENAVQHTAPGGTIRLGWRHGHAGVELWVADDGEGIATEDLPHIFEPFYRGQRGRSKRAGTGLGLALVRSIVEAHGGQVRVDSRPGEGACFTLMLPHPPPAPHN